MKQARSHAPPAWSPAPVGAELVPGIRVVELLTHGRRLDTYDAWDEARACRVVVKIVREDRRGEPDVLEAFERERTLLTTLAHPHLVRGYESVDDPPGVVMETLTGATLDVLLERGPLVSYDAALLGQHLVSALGYLHRHGVLHLDVKPANVVVDNGRAVLIDFSHCAPPGDGIAGSGTLAYMAPEQHRGRDLGAATDVWLLGATLREALTATPPRAPRTVPLRSPRPARRVRLRRLPPEVPTGLASVLTAALAPRPGDRPTLDEVGSACIAVAGDPRS